MLTAEPGSEETEDDVGPEDPKAQRCRGKLSLDDGLYDVVVTLAPERLQYARPAPVCGDEGTGEGAGPIRQREDRAGERKLEPDQVDRDERGLLGRSHHAGNRKADGGHRGICKQEEEELIAEYKRFFQRHAERG